MRIGIIIGSIRDGRAGQAVAEWVLEHASRRDDADFELVDLKTFDLPLLTSATVPGAAKKQYDDPRVTAWSQAIDALDAFVFVTPEYNHSVPGAFKNAFDSLGPEWTGKAVGVVSYGAESGVRAVEAWRPIVANFQMVDVRQQVSLSTFGEFDGTQVTPNDRRPGELGTLLDQVEKLTRTLRG